MFKQEELDTLKRASHRAALLSALGAVIVFASLAYSGKKLNALDTQVREKTQRIETLVAQDQKLQAAVAEHAKLDAQMREQFTSHKAEDEALQKKLDELRREVETLEKTRVTLMSETSALKGSIRNITFEVQKVSPSAVKMVTDLKPISALVIPRAKYEAVPGMSTRAGDGRVFDFYLWLDFYPGEKPNIRKVSYEFNHPTFQEKTVSSTDPSQGYRVSYRGWGCLRSVIITVELTDGRSEKVDFAMCDAMKSAEIHAK